MEPTRDAIVDLLDRILDKGAVVQADLIITVADIPLIGLNLNLALAGIETMLEYGLMEDWDQAQRVIDKDSEDEETQATKVPTLSE